MNSPVSKFMTKRFICLQHDTPLLEAAKQTVTSGAVFLVIMDGRRPVSVLDTSELLKLMLSGRDEDELLVLGTSRETALVCSRHTSTRVALDLLEESDSSRIVVLGESGNVVGVVFAEQPQVLLLTAAQLR